MHFEWDENKNRINIHKHGINFKEAIHVFSDPDALVMADHFHTESEERFLLLGKNLNSQILLIVYTVRHDKIIRIISARRATQKEIITYWR